MKLLSYRAIVASLLLFSVLCGLGCAPTSETSDGPALTDAALLVAEDRLGPITFADLDRYLLTLDPGRRWQEDVEPAQWYGSVARRVATDRLLADEARMVGADQDPELRRLEHAIERNVYSQHYLQQQPDRELPPGEEELRAYYEENGERFERGERREIYHIFRRIDDPQQRQQALDQLEALRQRAQSGESFELLAREHSDSETRHQDGRLGLVPRGHFSEDFDRVVFALQPKVPSEVVRTADGAHLFWVGSVLEERTVRFEEVRRLIYRELELQRRARELQQAASALPRPDNAFLPSEEELGRILALGEANALVMRLGEFRLSARELREQVTLLRRQGGSRRDPMLPMRVYVEIRDRELIYQHLLAEGLPELGTDRLEQERQRQLVDYYAQRRMGSWLERQPARVESHYQDNLMRFATPLRVRLRRLAVPLGSEGPKRMARLETARAQLDDGELDLDQLASDLGGQVRELGPVGAARLRATDTKALRFAFTLQPGEHSPPYQLGETLVMFQVVEREEPKPRPLALVRQQVVSDYLAHYSPEIFSQLSQQLLEEAGFQLFEDRLQQLGPVVPTS